jgi:phosphatidylserine decarboxylase
MTIHREGYTILSVSAIIMIALNAITYYTLGSGHWLFISILVICIVLYLLFLQFFRYPKRNLTLGNNLVVAPADGKVVVIEEVYEGEYFKDKRLQVSIFMSPINVHANWYPIAGLIKYVAYHKGKYLVAWHPKASTENERSTIVIQKDDGREILLRQIAGALAKRIVYYPHQNDKVRQCGEMGFIKFGSRVDLYFPLGTIITAKIGQKTTGGVTVIAEM